MASAAARTPHAAPVRYPPVRLGVRLPVESRVAIRVYRHVSQITCPGNVRYAALLPDGSPFAPPDALAGKDARRLSRQVLAMDADA